MYKFDVTAGGSPVNDMEICIYDADTGDYVTRIALGSDLFLTCFPVGASAGYLVTGGAGSIGSHLVHRLVRDGHAVRAQPHRAITQDEISDRFATGTKDSLVLHQTLHEVEVALAILNAVLPTLVRLIEQVIEVGEAVLAKQLHGNFRHRHLFVHALAALVIEANREDAAIRGSREEP